MTRRTRGYLATLLIVALCVAFGATVQPHVFYGLSTGIATAALSIWGGHWEEP